MTSSTTLTPNHLAELTASCIDPQLAQLNCISLDGDEAIKRFLDSVDANSLTNRSQVDAVWRALRKRSQIQAIEQGALFFESIDPLTDASLDWVRCKPDSPRVGLTQSAAGDWISSSKVVKYETPPKQPLRLSFFRVTLEQWNWVAARYGYSSPKQIEVLPSGEARGFWSWMLAKTDIPLIVTEGEKKALALLSLGFPAISVPGVNCAYRREAGGQVLHPDLLPFLNEKRPVIIAYDCDAKRSTRRAVDGAIATTAKLLESYQARVQVARWNPELGKGIDDLIAAGGDVESMLIEAASFRQWQQQRGSALTYPTAIAIDPKQHFLELENEIMIPDDARLIALRAPKGSGKTEFLARLVAEAQLLGVPCLVITHRIQLAVALAERFGIPHVSEIKDDPMGKVLGYSLCLDSMCLESAARFDPDVWHDAYVVIDEAAQAFWHLLESQTEVRKRRTEIVHNFGTLLHNVLSSDLGKVFLSDADLSDVEVNYVLGLANLDVPLTPFVIRHDRVGSGYDCTVFTDGEPVAWWLELKGAIELGHRVLVHCGAQKARAKWSCQNLEARLRVLFPHLRILRVDSETIADPLHPAFACTKRINDCFANYDVVIVSPTIETGVSIDLVGHFDSVWIYAPGQQSTDAVRQAAMRLREPVPRFLWCPTFSRSVVGSGQMSARELLAFEHGRMQVTLRALRKADALLSNLDLDGAGTLHSSESCWAAMAARFNQGQVAYRQTIVDGLIAEGCRVVFRDKAQPGVGLMVRQELKANQEQTYGAYQSEICSAERLDSSQFRALSEKRERTAEEIFQLKRAELEEEYGVDVSPELIEAHESGLGMKWRLHYSMFVAREFLDFRDRQRLQVLTERGEVFVRDASKCVKLPQVLVLERLGVKRLLDFALANPDTDWSNDSRRLKSLLKLLRQHCLEKGGWRAIKLAFSPPKSDETPIQLFKRLVRLFGFELHQVGRQSSGRRHRLYRLVVPDDLRERVFSVWYERDLAALHRENERCLAAQSSPILDKCLEGENIACNADVGMVSAISYPSTDGNIKDVTVADGIVGCPNLVGSAGSTVWRGWVGRVRSELQDISELFRDSIERAKGRVLTVESEPFLGFGGQWLVSCAWPGGCVSLPVECFMS